MGKKVKWLVDVDAIKVDVERMLRDGFTKSEITYSVGKWHLPLNDIIQEVYDRVILKKPSGKCTYNINSPNDIIKVGANNDG